jgi:hypothetical protein
MASRARARASGEVSVDRKEKNRGPSMRGSLGIGNGTNTPTTPKRRPIFKKANKNPVKTMSKEDVQKGAMKTEGLTPTVSIGPTPREGVKSLA